jgi:hypothetical protein
MNEAPSQPCGRSMRELRLTSGAMTQPRSVTPAARSAATMIHRLLDLTALAPLVHGVSTDAQPVRMAAK